MLVVVSLLAGIARAQDTARPLTLPEAMQLALKNSPDLAVAQQRVRIARAGLQQTEAALWPQIRIGASYAASDNPVQAFMMTLNQRAFDMATVNFNHPDTTDNLNGRVLAQWSLYDGGQTIAQRQAAQLHTAAARQQLAAARNDLIFEVTRAYHTIGKARQFVAAAEAAVNSLEATAAITSNRYVAGQALKTDYLDAQVRLAEARENLLRAGNALTLSELVFRTTIGLDPREKVTAREPDPRDATVAAASPDTTVPRPELAAARHATAAAEKQIRAAQAGHWPRLHAFASYDLDSGDASRFEGSWVAGIGIELPLFDGLATRGKIAEARARLETARQQQRKLELAVALEVRQAELALAEARARLDTAGQSVAQAEESLTLLKDRYAEGLALLNQVLDAEAALTAARQRRAAAAADVRIAEAALDRARGKTGEE